MNVASTGFSDSVRESNVSRGLTFFRRFAPWFLPPQRQTHFNSFASKQLESHSPCSTFIWNGFSTCSTWNISVQFFSITLHQFVIYCLVALKHYQIVYYTKVYMMETLLLTNQTNHEHGKSYPRGLSVRTVRPQMVSTPRHQERAASLPQMQESILERSKEESQGLENENKTI